MLSSVIDFLCDKLFKTHFAVDCRVKVQTKVDFQVDYEEPRDSLALFIVILETRLARTTSIRRGRCRRKSSFSNNIIQTENIRSMTTSAL